MSLLRQILRYRGACMGSHAPAPFALECEDLWAGHAGASEPALRGVGFQVHPGQRIALVGANGAGKSTLLQVIAGTLPIWKGRVRVFGHAPGLCQHRVVWLAQRANIDWTFPVTVRRFVLGGRFVHLGWCVPPGADDRVKADAALELMGLGNLGDRLIGELSGGQQQRALLARALAQGAELYLLDEPLNAVDQDTRAVVASVLDQLKAEGRTVVMSTHDIGRIESDFDHALFLSEGRQVPLPPGSFVPDTATCHHGCCG